MATIESVSGADTPNTGRTKWNAADSAMNAEIVAATSAIATHKAAGNTDHDERYSKVTDLNTHKTSVDHDGRYYTEAEIDAMVMKLAGVQDISGMKTFLADLILKKANPAIEFRDASGTEIARIAPLDADSLALQVWSGGAWKTRLIVDSATGGIYDGDAGAMASRAYVEARIRTGFFFIPLQLYIPSYTVSTTYTVQDKADQLLRVPIPNGAILRKTTVRWINGSASEEDSESVPAAFTEGGYRWITAQLVATSDDRIGTLELYAWQVVGGTLTSTKISNTVGIQTDGGFGGAVTVFIGLEFSI